MGNNSVKSKTQILEGLVSLILAVEKDFQPYASQFMSHLATLAQDKDFAIRKMSIDTIYTITKMHPVTLKPYKKELTDILTDLKFDKMKPVREVATETLNTLLREVPDPPNFQPDKDTPKNS